MGVFGMPVGVLTMLLSRGRMLLGLLMLAISMMPPEGDGGRLRDGGPRPGDDGQLMHVCVVLAWLHYPSE
jgi:hypothetical protein